MKKWLMFLLMGLLLTSCTAPQSDELPTQSRWIKIYYENTAEDEPIIGSDTYETSAESGLVIMAREALERMKEQPLQNKLKPALPSDVAIQALRYENGVMYVDFSSEYDKLTGLDKTISETCIAMTLANFWNIEKAVISVNGDSDNKPMYVRDYVTDIPAVLGGDEQVTVYLKEPDRMHLVPSEFTVPLDGVTLPEEYAASILANGIEGSRLVSPLPEGCVVQSVKCASGVCYISFSKELLNAEDGKEAMGVIRSIVCTLASVDYVDSVKILVDGADVEGFNIIDLRKEYSANNFNV